MAIGLRAQHAVSALQAQATFIWDFRGIPGASSVKVATDYMGYEIVHTA